jgi:hypothetical protein
VILPEDKHDPGAMTVKPYIAGSALNVVNQIDYACYQYWAVLGGVNPSTAAAADTHIQVINNIKVNI